MGDGKSSCYTAIYISQSDGRGRTVARLLTRAKFIKTQDVLSSSQFQSTWALSSVFKESWALVHIIANCLKNLPLK